MVSRAATRSPAWAVASRLPSAAVPRAAMSGRANADTVNKAATTSAVTGEAAKPHPRTGSNRTAAKPGTAIRR